MVTVFSTNRKQEGSFDIEAGTLLICILEGNKVRSAQVAKLSGSPTRLGETSRFIKNLMRNKKRGQDGVVVPGDRCERAAKFSFGF